MKESKRKEEHTGDENAAPSPKVHRLQHLDQEDILDADQQYRKVPGKPPLAAWLVSLVTIGERWSYYAFLGPFQNYIQNRADDPLRPGALGLGQAKAALLVNIFLILSYTTPLVAEFLADDYFGRYRVILSSLIVYTLGVAVLFITSLPSMIDCGAGLPGLIVAIITISAALGGTNASIPPLLAEQCEQVPRRVTTTSRGEKVAEDPDVTLQHLFDIVGYQVPVYVLEGLSEIFASPAGYEFAFTKAPKSLKSVIQAMYGLTAAAGSIIAIAQTPLNRDPTILGVYAGISGAMFLNSIAAYCFYIIGRRTEPDFPLNER